MARGKPHDADVKARARAGLLLGLGVSEIAQMLGLNESSVRNWKNELSDQELANASVRRGQRLEALTFGYVEQLLLTLTAQAKVAGETNYIKAQSASGLTILHDKLASTTFRILAAIPTGIQPELDAEPESGTGSAGD